MFLKHLHNMILVLQIEDNRPLLHVFCELDTCLTMEVFRLVSLEKTSLKISARNCFPQDIV